MASPFAFEEPGLAPVMTDEEREELLGTPARDDAAEMDEEPIEIEDAELLQILWGYLDQAEEARETGLSARETEWKHNWDAYWTRYDSSDKEEWQADESLPDVQNAVDRFAASLRAALVQGGEWYDVKGDPGGEDSKLRSHVRRFMDALLARAGKDVTTGHPIGFDTLFGDAMKAGCLMAACMQVRVDMKGRVRVENVDAREVMLDPTGRSLYRIRRYEMDWHKLMGDAEEGGKDAGWRVEAVRRLRETGGKDEEGEQEKEDSSGSSWDSSGASRKPVKLHEFRCDLVSMEGELLAENYLVLMGDRREILRFLPNPFWHKQDWIVYAPLVSVPFSVYGRSFVEGFRRLVDTFVSYTNLILDAAFSTVMKAYMLWTNALEDPAQADSIHPMKVFLGSDEVQPGTPFVMPVDMGQMPAGAVTVWQALKTMIREAEQQNELSLGQLPPKGDITATEIVGVQQGQSELVRSVARDVEQRILSPVLSLVWATGLQFLDPEDAQLRRELGDDAFEMLLAQREGFRDRHFQFQAMGISETIRKADRVRAMLSVIQTAAENPILLATFRQRYSLERLMEEILKDMGLDLGRFELTPEEQQRAQLASQQAALDAERGAVGGGGGGPGGAPGLGREGPV